MKHMILSGLLGAGLFVGMATAADIVVHVRPPAVRVEHRPARPGRNYVWVGGYHRWDGNGYAWEAGRWAVPPREHAIWVAPRWQHRRDGYVFVDGRWR